MRSTIEDAGYREVPYPEMRCPDRHLADAEDISLRLSFRIRPVPVRFIAARVATRLRLYLLRQFDV
jgi:hypothetical protein